MVASPRGYASHVKHLLPLDSIGPNSACDVREDLLQAYFVSGKPGSVVEPFNFIQRFDGQGAQSFQRVEASGCEVRRHLGRNFAVVEKLYDLHPISLQKGSRIPDLRESVKVLGIVTAKEVHQKEDLIGRLFLRYLLPKPGEELLQGNERGLCVGSSVGHANCTLWCTKIRKSSQM